MGKVVEESYFCDVCGVSIEGKVTPIPRAIREVGYWGDYKYTEYEEVRFCIRELELCEVCKKYSDTRLIGMVSEMGTDQVKYKGNWLNGY